MKYRIVVILTCCALYHTSIVSSHAMIGEEFNKATGKTGLIFVSTQQEKKIGASVSRQVDEKFEDTDDPLIQLRIEEIGARIASVCERKDLIYRFKVLKSEEKDYYNAFAVPGGYVYIFDTLVNKLKSDDEIAAILAHEVGHIAAKHSIQRLQSGLGMQALMILGMGMRTDRRTLGQAYNALNHLMSSYSRECEIEADRISIRYVQEAGYDAEAVVRVLKLLQHIRKRGKLRNYTLYRSHPYLSERISEARSTVQERTDFDSYINLPMEMNTF